MCVNNDEKFPIRLFVLRCEALDQTFCDTGKAREGGMPPHRARWRQQSRFPLGLHWHLWGGCLLLLVAGGSSGSTDSSRDWAGRRGSWLLCWWVSPNSLLGLLWHHASGVLGMWLQAHKDWSLNSLLNLYCLEMGEDEYSFQYGAWLG